jgi:hypothetical protein
MSRRGWIITLVVVGLARAIVIRCWRITVRPGGQYCDSLEALELVDEPHALDPTPLRGSGSVGHQQRPERLG